MAWPTPQDYNEAIQNPQSNFDDPELKAGTPELTPLGLPRPITGGFASVYRMHCGTHDWAVRCFLREYADQQKRYAAISQHLATARLPYTLGFQFLPQGIRIRGQWVPILKMEWAQGELLNSYIEKHLHDPAALKALAQHWLAMTSALQSACVAHGDLQHGNVLVANGNLKLIDYDGMYVPALVGQLSHEVGHRNYQHPQRSERDFGPYLDHFSAWVIYVSLVALSEQPDLWNQVGGGDEYLLFRQEDFAQPGASSTLALLTGHTDAHIRSLAVLFESLLCHGPRDIPTLESLLAPRPPAGSGRKRAPRAGKPAPVAAPATPSTRPAWLTEHIAQSDPAKTFQLPMTLPRALAASTLPACALVELVRHSPLAFLYSLIVCLCLDGLAVALRYWQEPAIREMRALRVRQRAVRNDIAAVERTLRDYERQKEALRTEETHRREALEHLKTDLEAKEKRELGQVYTALKRTRDLSQARHTELDEQRLVKLEKARKRFLPGVQALTQRIEALEKAREEERAKTLDARQEEFVYDFLRGQKLWQTPLPGIGRAFKLRLLLRGFAAAADFTEARLRNMHGLSEKKAKALLAWRHEMEAEAQAQQPDALSTEERQRIDSWYDSRIQRLEAHRDQQESRLAEAEEAVRAQFDQQAQNLEARKSAEATQAAQSTKAIRQRFVPEYDSIAQALARLAPDTEAKCAVLEARIAEARQPLPRHNWQLTEVSRALDAYRQLSLGSYVRSVFWKQR
jgi:hypothetical protein